MSISRKNENQNDNNEVVRKTKGRPNSIDHYVGSRLRLRRTLLGYSQEKLSDAIGLTFQQVQKYERGTNRISASRLYQFSKILDVPVTYFFDKYGQSDYAQAEDQIDDGLSDNEQSEFADADLLNKKETLDLIRVYYSIKNPKVRKDLFKLVKSMAENMKDQ